MGVNVLNLSGRHSSKLGQPSIHCEVIHMNGTGKPTAVSTASKSAKPTYPLQAGNPIAANNPCSNIMTMASRSAMRMEFRHVFCIWLCFGSISHCTSKMSANANMPAVVQTFVKSIRLPITTPMAPVQMLLKSVSPACARWLRCGRGVWIARCAHAASMHRCSPVPGACGG